MRPAKGAALLTLTALALGGQPAWQRRYSEPAGALLHLTDLAAPAAGHVVAAGVLHNPAGTTSGLCLSTGDGGKTWQRSALPEGPRSLFFLDRSQGWMVTASGVWGTSNGGLEWRKLYAMTGLERVYFVTAFRGWAVGANKTVLETADGGGLWTRVAAASEPETSRERTVYNTIAFAGPRSGIIVGRSNPPRIDDRQPPGREVPAITIILSTNNGGGTWIPSTASVFGRIVRAAFEPGGAGDRRGLGLIHYDGIFEFPSEVMRLGAGGASDRVYASADFRVTDIVWHKGAALLAGRDATRGTDWRSTRGRVRVYGSADLKAWAEVPLEPSIAAKSAMLATDAGSVWLATSEGQLFELQD